MRKWLVDEVGAPMDLGALPIDLVQEVASLANSRLSVDYEPVLWPRGTTAVMKNSVYKKYMLTVLMVTLAFNHQDRLALGLVMQDIKIEFDMSDAQLGLLTGFAFAVFYSVMGIPIARWADRGNRAFIISGTLTIWSFMVALCGFATNFVQLLLMRIGVAVGEAGCVPPAHSLMADEFTRAERPRAFARYQMGVSLGVIIGYFFAGWLNQLYGWRMMFIILGLPGVLLGILAFLTLREPRRIKKLPPAGNKNTIFQHDVVSAPVSQPSMPVVFLTLWKNITFRNLLISMAIMSFFAAGIVQWQPTFFVRSYDIKTGELGTWLAIIYGVCGVVGTYSGGELITRFAANKENQQLKIVTFMCFGFTFMSLFTYLSPNIYVAFALIALSTLALSATHGPMFATIQTLVPQGMRAMAIAIILLFSNLVGIGVGSLTVGIASDLLQPIFGEESLRYALMAMSPGYLLGSWFLWKASSTITDDLRAAHAA